MADKCIGKLTLDISDVEKKVNAINEALGKIGSNAKVKINIAEEVKKQINAMYEELQNGAKKIGEAANEAVKAIEKIGRAKGEDASAQNIRNALSLYEKLYNAKMRVYELQQKEQQGTTAYAKAEADVTKYQNALDKLSEKTKNAAKATKEYDAILNKTVSVENAAKATREAQEVDKATQAYLKLLEAKSKVKQLEAEGKQDTRAYTEATQAAGRAYDAFIKYSEGAREAAKASKEAAQARKDLNRLEEKSAEQGTAKSYLDDIKQKYFELTDAIKNYNSAKKSANTLEMGVQQAKIDSVMTEVGIIEQAVSASNMEASAKQQVLNIVQQCVTAENQFNASTHQSVGATSELESQVTGMLTRYLSLVAVIRTMTNLFRNMVDYVSEYSDKMSEIQMITLKSGAEVEQLAEKYRNIAQEMKVSSLDIADAAIYFTRQGLGAEEIENRLRNVTMYAKAANVEFTDASEIITSVINSMGLMEQEAEDGRNAAQRVADVFLNIGDNAATSGQEIGEAMQKAAASAGAFGVSMEWLASYIAAVSETTRQEARTIGTAFNTIIARLHQIKQTGYNADDETKINDIAKALSKIDIVLMDQSGNWRDMEVILEEIASKWGELDGKTRSYIATTMAGVKQQNVFLALMNDMSKGVEEGSRVYELHEKAVKSNGVAEEKYAVYLDSVAASQEKLNVAQEKFYSLLGQDVIKNWNNTMADWIDMITGAADAMDGMNIIIPLIVAGITGVTLAIHGMNMGMTTTISLASMLEKHPIMMAMAAAIVVGGVLATVISAIGDSLETSTEKFTNANNAITESRNRINTYVSEQEQLKKMLQDVGTEAPMTSEQLEKYNGLLDDLARVSPTAASAVEQLRNGMITQGEAAKILNAELDRVIQNEQKLGTMNLMTKYSNWSPTENEDTRFVSYMTNWRDAWYQGATGNKGFENALKNAYEYSTTYNHDQINIAGYLTQEVLDEINNQIKAYQNANQPEDWGVIASVIWSKFVGSTTDNVADLIKEQAEAAIDDVMTTLGATLNTLEYNALRKQLVDAVFGEDGELSNDEYQNLGRNITKFLSDIMSSGFDFSNVDPNELLTQTGESVFGQYFSILFQDQIDKLKESEYFDETVKMISSVIASLFDAGFSQMDLADLLGNIKLEEWDQAVSMMQKRLVASIAKNAGMPQDLFVLDAQVEWENMDVSLLKYINDLVQGGVAFTDIRAEVIAANGDVGALTEKLEEMGEAAKQAATSTEEETDNIPKTFEEAAKDIKSYNSEIEKLDAHLKTLGEGKALKASDMIDLFMAHPELSQFMDDIDQLKQKLLELRKQTEATQREEMEQFVLSSADYFMSTPYASKNAVDENGKPVENMREYVGTLDDGTEALTEALQNIEKAVNILMGIDQQVEEETAKETKDWVKQVEDSQKEIEKIMTVIQGLKEGQPVDDSDLLNLAMQYPELVQYVDQLDQLQLKLQELQNKAQAKNKTSMRNYLSESEAFFQASPFAGKTDAEGKPFANLLEYTATLSAGSAEMNEATTYLDNAVNKMMGLDQKVQSGTTHGMDEWVKKIQTAKDKIEDLDSYISTLESGRNLGSKEKLNLFNAYPQVAQFLDNPEQLKQVLENVRSEAAKARREMIEEYIMDSSEFFKQTPYAGLKDSEGKLFTSMREYVGSLDDGSQELTTAGEYIQQCADNIENASIDLDNAATTWLETQAKIAATNEALNWAKSNKFSDQIAELQAATESGGIEEAIKTFEGWSKEMQEAVGSEYPEFILAMGKAKKAIREQSDETLDLTKETANMAAVLNKASKLNEVKYFTDAAKAIKQLTNGTISATDAYEVYDKEINKVTKAYEDILDVQDKMAYNAREVNKDNQQAIDAADVSNLASLLNMTTDEILADFPAANDMFNSLISDVGELTTVLNMLNDAAFVRITGTSDADFSAIEAGLISVQNLADEAVQKLLATGQWTTEVIDLPQTAAIWNPGSPDVGGGYWSYDTVSAGATVLRPAGNNLFSGSSTIKSKTDTKSKGGGGGGGGGGSKNSKNSGMTEVERMLDIMTKVNAIQESQQNYYQSQQKFYEQTGKLQGVIVYLEREQEVLEEQNGTLETNIRRIEEYMEKKRAELATLQITDEEYEEVADDLDKLQKAHQTYTKQLIDNKTAIDALTESIDEQRKKIRQMEIDLRETVLKAIEDRERRTEDMLNAEIEMENTILDLITKRYEKERDEIIDTTNRRIDLLKDERDLLDEQLRLRKEQAEEEDKMAQLAEYEAQYQRIIADPTRKKEALEIQKKITELREEMAWDAAEKEVEKQQKSIDQQVTSLEDYIAYIEDYYEDLFAHPKKLIDEMKEIISMSDAEIIEWLKANEEEYEKSTENTRGKMVTGWQATLDEMHGIIKTYWDEVEAIIEQGDDAIIEFLKENSDDYRTAGKLQAEAYVEEWKKQLEDLKKAHEEVQASVAPDYDVIEAADKSSGSSKGGGGGGGGGNNKSSGDEGKKDITWTVQKLDSQNIVQAPTVAGIATTVELPNTAAVPSTAKLNGSKGIDIKSIMNQNKLGKHATGGMVDYTGLAWLDGSLDAPERVLSPYQTELFETMVAALERASRISIPAMQSYGDFTGEGGNPVSVGDIIVNVDNLDTDDDYEELARKVGNIIMERIGRTAVVGGMRISSY